MPSLANTLLTWDSTVLREMNSWLQIESLEYPCAMRLRISRSLSVSASSGFRSRPRRSSWLMISGSMTHSPMLTRRSASPTVAAS